MKKTIAILVSLAIMVTAISSCSNASPSRDTMSSIGESSGMPAPPAIPAPLADSEVGGVPSAMSPSESVKGDEALVDMDVPPDDGSGQQQTTFTRPGLLTAGEWNDNENHDFISNLIQTNSDFRTFERMWQFNLRDQIIVNVSDNGSPVNNVMVDLLDESHNVIYSARTNNNGIAYLFNNLRNTDQNEAAFISVPKATSDIQAYDPDIRTYEFSISDESVPKSLDLMFVIDTTGSMSDELEFLKVELEDIINQVSAENANMDIRLSVNVYRDTHDQYVVRSTAFKKDISDHLSFLSSQYAGGGDDWEEAVEQALADALEDHDWNDDATAKLMFMVLDAPPHNTNSIISEMHRLTALSSKMGVRIIPIASSGIDKVTEFLLRSLSMATGGTYVFITDHSGVGDAHIEPTIGPYEVELLNELIIRVINEYTA